MEITISAELCQKIKQLEMERIAYADLMLKAMYEKQVDAITIEELKQQYLERYYQLDNIKTEIREQYNLNTDDWYLDLRNKILTINILNEEEKEEN